MHLSLCLSIPQVIVLGILICLLQFVVQRQVHRRIFNEATGYASSGPCQSQSLYASQVKRLHGCEGCHRSLSPSCYCTFFALCLLLYFSPFTFFAACFLNPKLQNALVLPGTYCFGNAVQHLINFVATTHTTDKTSALTFHLTKRNPTGRRSQRLLEHMKGSKYTRQTECQLSSPFPFPLAPHRHLHRFIFSQN
jgi:hypothetical protein